MHEKFMDRCLELARLGMGHTAPNPMVGSVIVRNGLIIGEGYHMKCGEAHAEVNAINSVSDYELLKDSTLYVNLEPCSHFGKTPPCSKLILEKQIPRVVVGCVDPSSKVSGKGIEMLRNSGCNVILGVREEESININKRFFTFHGKQRPYIILKWAQTKDGFIDIEHEKENGERGAWITNDLAKTLVHKWRSEESSILIGTNTAEIDNPKLNVREWTGKSPLRLVIDRELRLDKSLYVFDSSVPTIVYSEKEDHSSENIEYVNLNFEKSLPNEILDDLYRREVLSVIIEGGTFILQSFIDKGLWDEARIFTGTAEFMNGVKAPLIKGNEISKEDIAGCTLEIIVNG